MTRETVRRTAAWLREKLADATPEHRAQVLSCVHPEVRKLVER